MPTETFFRLPPDKRQRVVDAALAEFAEFGYEAASISRMVSRAGIAKGSFYQYFTSKLDLFEWLLLDELSHQKLAFVQRHPPPPGSDFFTTLEIMSFLGIRWALDHPNLARMAEAVWGPSSDPDLRALAARVRQITQRAMVALLKAGQEAGQVRSNLELDLAATVLSAALQQGTDRALWERYGLDLIGLMKQPERAREVTDEQLRALVAGVVDILRRGMGCEGGEWSPARLDIQQLVDDMRRDR